MKVYHAKNLIISTEDSSHPMQPLFGSRSCDLSVSAESIPTSSPSDGEWKHVIAGRKSWQVTTNHLLISAALSDGKITAKSYGYQGVSTTASFVIDGTGARKEVSSRGLSVIKLGSSAPYSFQEASFTTFDTYNKTSSELQPMLSEFLTYLSGASGSIVAIVGFDAISLPYQWTSAISQYLHVSIPSQSSRRQSVAIIGGDTLTTGVYTYGGNDGTQEPTAQPSLAEIWLQNGNILTSAVMKSMIERVGQKFYLKANILNMPYDEVGGYALCRQFRVSGSVGNLLQGSFAFEGDGALS